MSKLSKVAQSGIDRAARRPDLPAWWVPMQITATAIFALFVVFQLMGGSLNQKSIEGTGWVPVTSSPAPISPEPVTPTTPVASGTQELRNTSTGLLIVVDSAAVEQATRGALSLFTGNQSGIVLPDGVAPQPNLSTTKNAVVTFISVTQKTDTLITFAITIETADKKTRILGVTSILQGSTWRYSPEA